MSVAILVLIALVPGAAALPGDTTCLGARVDGEEVLFVTPGATSCPTTVDGAPQCVTVLPGPYTPGIHGCTPALVVQASR